MWFYYLNNKEKESLLNVKSVQKNNLVVCQEEQQRKYTLFESYGQFLKYYNSQSTKCFYEIILTNQYRVPYFDVDVEDNIESFDENVFKNMLHTKMKEIFGNNQMLVYSSNTVKKKSYHILIRNVYLHNEKECANFYKFFIKDLDPNYAKYFDSSVYKSTQQFRIYGCHKYGKDNVKVLRKDLCYNYTVPKRHLDSQEIYNLYSSLLTNITGCTYLEGFEEIEVSRPITLGAASQGDVEKVLDMVYYKFSYDLFTYCETKESNGNLLLTFRRKAASYCKNCNRVHEHENPFVTVVGLERNVYFYCRRGEQKEYLGKLGAPSVPEVSVDDIPIIDNLVNELEEISLKFQTPKYKGKVSLNGLKLSMY